MIYYITEEKMSELLKALQKFRMTEPRSPISVDSMKLIEMVLDMMQEADSIDAALEWLLTPTKSE